MSNVTRIPNASAHVITPRRRCARSVAAVCWVLMSDVTQLLDAIERGDPNAASQLLPLVADELRRLADALTRLAAEDADAAEVVKLHFFAGLTLEQVAEALGVSRATVYRNWAYARAWLHCALGSGA